MRAVNLLPRDADVGGPSGKRLPLVVTIGLVAAVTLFAGFLGMQASAQADERRGDLELTEASLARIPKREQQPVAPDMSAERSNRVAAFQSALSTRVPVDKVMRELTYVVPEDVWLNGLTVIVPTETGPAAGQTTPGSATETPATVTVKGATYSQASIARFIARLSALSSLENVRLTESARVEPQADAPAAAGAKTKKPSKKQKQKVVVTFTATADLDQGPTS